MAGGSEALVLQEAIELTMLDRGLATRPVNSPSRLPSGRFAAIPRSRFLSQAIRRGLDRRQSSSSHQPLSRQRCSRCSHAARLTTCPHAIRRFRANSASSQGPNLNVSVASPPRSKLACDHDSMKRRRSAPVSHSTQTSARNRLATLGNGSPSRVRPLAIGCATDRGAREGSCDGPCR